MGKKYIIIAVVLISIVIGAYIIQFYFRLNYTLSSNTSAWESFSNYIGGILAPIFSFLSLIMLIKSLNLQNTANIALINEIEQNKEHEKLRSFETHFFNMLEAQRLSFNSFTVSINNENKCGIEAVLLIENYIEHLRNQDFSNTYIRQQLNNMDSNDKLSEKNKFSEEERKTYLKTLINFTEFSLLRIILICIDFLDYPSTNYLKNNKEFISVMDELGLKIDLY